MTARYTLIVGTKDWSSWSLRPWLAMKVGGIPFEEVVVPLRHDDTPHHIRQYSPSGRIPALKISDGTSEHLVWDSLAICETIAERHPEAKLWPEAPVVRAEARAYAAEMHSGFPDLREQLSMDFARQLPMPRLRDATKAQIARIIEAWTQALENHGKDGGYLFGRFSIADCMYAPVVSRFRTYGVEVPEIVQGYCDLMWSLPAMQEWGRAAKEEVDSGLA
ncbi:MAG TPA: glutathione S-transferase family protein [Rhizomicrobium sp.]|jgi:glutathione S-transferase